MRRVTGFIAALLLLLGLSFGVAGTAHAVCSTGTNPLGCACDSGGGVSGSDTCKTNGNDPIGGPNGALRKASLIIAFLGGITAIIVLIIGGLTFVLAGGDTQRVASARKMVIGAIVGLVIIATSETILLFVVKNL